MEETDEYETFWHVTSKVNTKSILENGLYQSILGIYDDGVYCIKKNESDRTELDNVKIFMERNGLPTEDQVAIEFEHLGNYYINNIRKMFEESGWVVIKQNIAANLIDKYFDLK